MGALAHGMGAAVHKCAGWWAHRDAGVWRCMGAGVHGRMAMHNVKCPFLSNQCGFKFKPPKAPSAMLYPPSPGVCQHPGPPACCSQAQPALRTAGGKNCKRPESGF